ncbi:uncharacterized protein LTR77_006169 [Saxophila tyrrhenica]|uniref:FAD-binding domain-containing protein n=1 Tax=Saxophila tyrrhenica TaxID=1690608 RepID=A0AAV9PBB1_9PEZI|nr:hypothetical protein LTR77_006169 [Saxophila tyrrhenica]
MKVVIIGAGLSGLSTALALRKYVRLPNEEAVEISIYDRADPHDTGKYGFNDHADVRQKQQGAAISLQPNALRVLRDLDPELADKVYTSGYPCTHFTWKTAGDILLGRDYLDLLPISRPILVQCLAEALPENVRIIYKTIIKVEPRQGSSLKSIVHFEDGTQEEADLLVGADGIRSPLRHCLFKDDTELAESKYLGVCAVGGVLDMPLPKDYLDDPCIVFAIGANGTFGYCGLNRTEANKLLYFSFYDSEEMPDRTKVDYQEITKHLRERHHDWADPLIHDCLSKADIDNVYPICYVPDLPHWGHSGCVLVGDAAHAMPPASGQGGSQAFEDGQSLALLLAGFLEKHNTSEGIEEAIKAFYDLRHGRVDKMKADGLEMERQPKRPWGWATTLMMYAGLSAMVQVKYLSSFIWKGDPVVDWDAKEEVRKYLAARE